MQPDNLPTQDELTRKKAAWHTYRQKLQAEFDSSLTPEQLELKRKINRCGRRQQSLDRWLLRLTRPQSYPPHAEWPQGVPWPPE